jgi:O-antigen ligase
MCRPSTDLYYLSVKYFLKGGTCIFAALCAFPTLLFVYQSLFTYFAVTLLSALLLIVISGYIICQKENTGFSVLTAFVFLWICYIICHTIVMDGERYRMYLYVGYGCFFLFVFLSIKNKLLDRNDITGIFYFFAIIESVICILQALGVLKTANGFFTVTGAFENPNITAIFLMACLPFGLFSIVRKYRISGIASIAILLISIILLQCRTAYAGVVLSFFVFICQNEKVKSVLKKHKIIFAGIVLIVLLSGIFLYNLKKESSDGRLFIWKISTKMIMEKPVFGFGYGLFERNYNLAQAVYFQSGKGTETERQNAGHVNMAYNEYIEQTIEGGIVGLIFYCAFLIFSIYSSLKRKDGEAFAVILTVFAASLFNFVIQCLPLCLLLFCYCASLNNSKMVKISRIYIVVIAFLSLVFLINQSKVMFAQIELKRALTLVNNGKKARALNILTKKERSAGTSEVFLRNYGKILMLNKNYGKAKVILEKSSVCSSNPDIYYALSDCYAQIRDFSKAEESLQIITKMIPSNLKSRYRLMCLYLSLNKRKEAKCIARKIIDMQPKIKTNEGEFYKKEAMHVLLTTCRPDCCVERKSDCRAR